MASDPESILLPPTAGPAADLAGAAADAWRPRGTDPWRPRTGCVPRGLGAVAGAGAGAADLKAPKRLARKPGPDGAEGAGAARGVGAARATGVRATGVRATGVRATRGAGAARGLGAGLAALCVHCFMSELSLCLVVAVSATPLCSVSSWCSCSWAHALLQV